MTYFDRKEGPTNNIERIKVVGSDNIEINDKVVYKNMYSTIF